MDSANGDGQPELVEKIVLTITFVPGRQCEVRADPPQIIGDKFLCYGILGGARDAIKDHNDRMAQQGIVAARQIPKLFRQ